jgi:hypothetical protein
LAWHRTPPATLGRHWDLDIGAAMGALDPNVTVFHVLWAKPDHFAAP